MMISSSRPVPTSSACATLAACSNEQPGFNWNHGDFQEQITRTWLGLVGPGVRRIGLTNELFSDHTDVRPTLLTLAGLKDDYSHDGRVLFEILDRDALPPALSEHDATLSRLAAAYKAINAPRGELGRRSLQIATKALAGDATTIGQLDGRLNDLTARRNALAGRMIAILEGAAFDGQSIDADEVERLIAQAQDLLASVR